MGLYWDNGKENGSYCVIIGIYWGYIVTVFFEDGLGAGVWGSMKTRTHGSGVFRAKFGQGSLPPAMQGI